MTTRWKDIPLLLWIALATLAAMTAWAAWLGLTRTPVLMAGAIVPAATAVGLYRGRPWAFALAWVLPVGHLAALLATGDSLLPLLLYAPVVAPAAASRRYFFPPSPLDAEVRSVAPNPSRAKQLGVGLLVVLLLFTGGRLAGPTLRMRDEHGLTINPTREGVPPKVALMTTALGVFRGFFINYLWLRSMEMKEENRFFEMVQIYDWITNLQPHSSKVWHFVGWDLTYNVAVSHDNLADRWYWVYRGMRYVRDKGIPYNRNDPNLYADLYYAFHHKIGGDLDYAQRFYRTEWARMMEEALGGPGDRETLHALVELPDDPEALLALPRVRPLVERLEGADLHPLEDFHRLTEGTDALPADLRAWLEEDEAHEAVATVQLFLRKQRLREEFKLDPRLMLELNNRYGPLDWRSADTHSLYWATLAMRMRNRQLERRRQAQGIEKEIVDLTFERDIYNALQRLVDRGRVYTMSEGFAYNLPDYRFADGALAHLRDLLDRSETAVNPRNTRVNTTGVRSAYTYLLKRTIVLYYFNGRLEDTGKYFRALREEHPDEEAYRVPPEVFVQNEIEDFVDKMDLRRYHAVVESYLRQSYLALALGDRQRAAEHEAWARKLYEYARKRWPFDPDREEQQYKYVTPLRDMSGQLLLRILEGQEPLFTPTLRARLRAIVPPEQVEAIRESLESGRTRATPDQPHISP